MYKNSEVIEEFFRKHKNQHKQEYTKKCILIDFDHIIGDFEQIHRLCNIYEKYVNRPISKFESYKIIDSYQYVFRPKIFEIFSLLNHSKLHFGLIAFSTQSKNVEFASMILNYIYLKIKTIQIHDIILDTEDLNHIHFIQSFIKSKNCHTFLCHMDSIEYAEIDKDHCLFILFKRYNYKHTIQEILKLFPYAYLKQDKKKIKKFIQTKMKLQNTKHHLPRSTYNISSIKLLAYLQEFIYHI